MKIGIITFHRAINLGAALQAFALEKYIDTNIGTAEILDFIPNNAISKNNSVMRRVLHCGKALLTIGASIRRERRRAKFTHFIENYCNLSHRKYMGDEDIQEEPPSYDFLIAGSDQIWNYSLSGKTKSYYLGFDHQAVKISYGSSLGKADASSEEIEEIELELPKYKRISVREKRTAEIIKQRTGIDAEMVVDPVFLLSDQEWNVLFEKAERKAKKPYIFVYAMEVNETIKDMVVAVKRKYRMPAIVVYGGNIHSGINGKTDHICGPEDFLEYINGAAVVITNSFHGVSFSIIKGKAFIGIAHTTRNIRLENLYQMFRSEQLVYDKSALQNIDAYIVDGKKALKNMILYINKSKEFLQSSLS